MCQPPQRHRVSLCSRLVVDVYIDPVRSTLSMSEPPIFISRINMTDFVYNLTTTLNQPVRQTTSACPASVLSQSYSTATTTTQPEDTGVRGVTGAPGGNSTSVPAPVPITGTSNINSGSTPVSTEASSATSSLAGAPTSTALADPGGKALANGAVAGIAIGMLLSGVFIAGVIFYFLSRRQKRRQAASTTAYCHQHASSKERNAGP